MHIVASKSFQFHSQTSNLVLGNMIMYPSIDHRMGNYGSNPISYGPPKPSYGAGKIPGYDLRVCTFILMVKVNSMPMIIGE